jgi:hypothetical protein
VCVVCAPLTIVEYEETVVVTQRLGEHVPAATNAHGTVVDLLDAVFYVRSMMYQISIERKVALPRTTSNIILPPTSGSS